MMTHLLGLNRGNGNSVYPSLNNRLFLATVLSVGNGKMISFLPLGPY